MFTTLLWADHRQVSVLNTAREPLLNALDVVDVGAAAKGDDVHPFREKFHLTDLARLFLLLSGFTLSCLPQLLQDLGLYLRLLLLLHPLSFLLFFDAIFIDRCFPL